MSDNKYRVHEVAKDFKINGKAVGSKKVMEILTKYGETPSSHMAVLSDKELSIIFDYLTQNNQIKDLEEVFKETYHEPKSGKGESKKPAPKGENKKQPAGDRKPQGDRRNGPKQGDQRTGEKRPQNNNDRRSAPAQKGADKAAAPRTLEQKASPAAQNGSRVPQKKVVNTRSSVDVNLDRYDAHLDELTPDSVEKMQHGKQKINSKRSQQQRSGKQSAKRRQEEQAQKMRRLQQEAARNNNAVPVDILPHHREGDGARVHGDAEIWKRNWRRQQHDFSSFSRFGRMTDTNASSSLTFSRMNCSTSSAVTPA